LRKEIATLNLGFCSTRHIGFPVTSRFERSESYSQINFESVPIPSSIQTYGPEPDFKIESFPPPMQKKEKVEEISPVVCSTQDAQKSESSNDNN
jgi:hypothetical protein